MKESNKQIVRGILLALGVIPVTWLSFGPIAGFHHMIGFGMTFYLMLDGETPMPGDYMWGDYAVRFFPARFAIGVLLWSFAIFVMFRVVRFLTGKGYMP